MSGAVVWLTGLPSSGKSALAERVAARLRAQDVACCGLDGDVVRAALRPSPGYDDAARDDFYATLAALAALVARQGLVALVPATAHRRAFRDRARALAPRFVEVLVDTPAEECARRDAKGLYARAAHGAVAAMPGVDARYERPEAPDVVAPGGASDEAVDAVLRALGTASAHASG